MPRRSSDDDELGSNDELTQRGSSRGTWQIASYLSETATDLIQVFFSEDIKLRRDLADQAGKSQLVGSSD